MNKKEFHIGGFQSIGQKKRRRIGLAGLLAVILLFSGCELRGIKLKAVFKEYLEAEIIPGQKVKSLDYQVLNLEFFANDAWLKARFLDLGELSAILAEDLKRISQFSDTGIGIAVYQKKLALRQLRQTEYTAAFGQRMLERGEVNAYGIYHLLDTFLLQLPLEEQENRAITQRAHDQTGRIIGQYGSIRKHYLPFFIDEISLWTRDKLYHSNRLASYLVNYELENGEKGKIWLEFDRKSREVTRQYSPES